LSAFFSIETANLLGCYNLKKSSKNVINFTTPIQQKNFKTDGEYPHLFNIKKIITNIFFRDIEIQISTLDAFEIIQQSIQKNIKKKFLKNYSVYRF